MTGVRSKVFSLAFLIVAGLWSGGDTPRTPVQSAEQKLHYVDENAKREVPDPRPTELSETEVNAYLASGKVRLPAGVEALHLVGTPGVINARCRVDFDRVRAGRANSNPLLRLFSGAHDVEADAQASGSNHRGHVHVNSVSIDGIEVPHFILELFVEKYVAPRYPGVGLDSTFALPDKIETATVGSHRLTVIQR